MKNLGTLKLSAIAAVALALVGLVTLIAIGGASAKRGAPGETMATMAFDQALAERGAYLATAANCVSCHTAPGGEAFAGGLSFETPFGLVYSTNITPDEATGIGSWTYEAFERSMRKGIGDGGEHLYPVFPYTSFAKITPEDMKALFAYFQSLDPVESRPLSNDMQFPFDQRWMLGGWKLLFMEGGTYEPDMAQTEKWNRGAYLTQALAHCAACHSPRNSFGAKKAGQELSGGIYMDKVPSGDNRKWSAPNLTSAQSGIGHWTAEELVAYLKVGKNTHAAMFGPMNEVIGNSTRYLTTTDLEAMATYFKSLPPVAAAARAQQASADKLGRGQTIYNIHCGTCHMPTGLGAPETGATLAGSPIVQAEDPASLLNVIIYGPELPDPWPPIGDWGQMPSFNDTLKDDEIAALASYMRQEWGHQAGEVTIEHVEVQRPPYDTDFQGLTE
ncbi:c-type cytochrome [Parvularcula sp. ZS-1/3]|uniref:C-type cytochrome n=1 Tax=Parvularcula mediterranea TaxID=2732508 RepID=A0A7Y3RL88_9PROT|nr:c-type cytochrome [Parvularcula mediterranea]